jgi:hypothetical protein
MRLPGCQCGSVAGSKDWKKKTEKFQGLESFGQTFPGLGKKLAKFSKPWKMPP